MLDKNVLENIHKISQIKLRELIEKNISPRSYKEIYGDPASNNNFYKNKLKNVNEIKILDFDIKKGEVPLWTDAYAFKKRDKLIEFLKKNNIECRKFWYPLHLQKPFKEKNLKFKTSSKIYNKLFWLPSSLNLNEKKITLVCNLIKKFYRLN